MTAQALERGYDYRELLANLRGEIARRGLPIGLRARTSRHLHAVPGPTGTETSPRDEFRLAA